MKSLVLFFALPLCFPFLGLASGQATAPSDVQKFISPDRSFEVNVPKGFVLEAGAHKTRVFLHSDLPRRISRLYSNPARVI